MVFHSSWTSLVAQMDGKVSAYNAGDQGLIPGLGRSSGEGNGNPFQYSCLENSMDGEAWQATVRRVTKSNMIERLTHTRTVLAILSIQFSVKYILVTAQPVSRMLHLWKMKLCAH